MSDDRCPETLVYGRVTVRCERPRRDDDRHWTDRLNWASPRGGRSCAV